MPHAASGSNLYTASEIAERAIRKVQATGINDDAVEEAYLYEALWWLDMMVAHFTGTNHCFWLMKQEQDIALTEDDGDYDLAVALPSLSTGVQFPILAMLEDSNGNREPLPIITQKQFREKEEPARTGIPEEIYIDRLNGPTLYPYPIPDATGATYTIVLTLQTFMTSAKPKGLTGSNRLGNENVGLRAAWNLWAVTKLAALIGDGPVAALDPSKIRTWQGEAREYEEQLLAFENREHDSGKPFTEASIYL